MYTASVMFDYYCSVLYLGGGVGLESTPPREGAGVLNVLEGDSTQNKEPSVMVWLTSSSNHACQPDQTACLYHA